MKKHKLFKINDTYYMSNLEPIYEEDIIKLVDERDKYKEVLDKIKEKVNQYEFISGYYDDNYDGEDTTYSHDTLKEDILKIVENELKGDNK